jgi:hypothetical protein
MLVATSYAQEIAVVHLPVLSKAAAVGSEEYPGCESVFFEQSCGSVAISKQGKTKLTIERQAGQSNQVVFRLQNVGTSPIEVPVGIGAMPLVEGLSEYRSATLELIHRAKGKDSSLGLINVFGGKAFPGTLVSLSPGQWVTFRLAAICRTDECSSLPVTGQVVGNWSEYEYVDRRERCLRERGAFGVRNLTTKRIHINLQEAGVLEGPQ